MRQRNSQWKDYSHETHKRCSIRSDGLYSSSDYPYGFTLRCQKKVWIETDPKHGQRIVEMTSNPKRPGLVWNKPKKSTYDTLCGAFIVEASDVGTRYGYQNKYEYTQDDVGHVKFMRVGNGGDVAFSGEIQRHVRPV